VKQWVGPAPRRRRVDDDQASSPRPSPPRSLPPRPAPLSTHPAGFAPPGIGWGARTSSPSPAAKCSAPAAPPAAPRPRRQVPRDRTARLETSRPPGPRRPAMCRPSRGHGASGGWCREGPPPERRSTTLRAGPGTQIGVGGPQAATLRLAGTIHVGSCVRPSENTPSRRLVNQHWREGTCPFSPTVRGLLLNEELASVLAGKGPELLHLGLIRRSLRLRRQGALLRRLARGVDELLET
jgi:hypothetical protein